MAKTVQEVIAEAEAALRGFRREPQAVPQASQEARLYETRFARREQQYADLDERVQVALTARAEREAQREAMLIAARNAELIRARQLVGTAEQRARQILRMDAERAQEEYLRYVNNRAFVGPSSPGRYVTFQRGNTVRRIYDQQAIALYDAWQDAERRLRA